eukprot:scaffold29727_cov131-Skeletonema_menzelii.AAC.1
MTHDAEIGPSLLSYQFCEWKLEVEGERGNEETRWIEPPPRIDRHRRKKTRDVKHQSTRGVNRQDDANSII